MLLMPSSGYAQSINKSVLISDKVEIETGSQYNLYIKEYSQKVLDYLANNKRIAVEFVSKSPDIVNSGGAWFRGLKPGECKMTVQIYQEHPDYMNYPDYDNMLDEVPFDVVVKNQVPVTPMTLVTEWGTSRDKIVEKMTKELGFTSFTKSYLKMNPTITPADIASYEIFLTNDFEFPLYYTYYDENNNLLSFDFLVSNADRMADPENSIISKYLQENGYEYLGYDESKWFVMYNSKTKTLASCGVLIVQGQFFMYCLFEYYPTHPTGITNQKSDDPTTMDMKYNGNIIEIIANGQEGKPVAIYSIDGKCLAKSTLKSGVNRFEMAKPMPVIVRAGNCLPVKMIP